MTLRLSYKNIAILGLVQVGVVVAGVLGAGSTYKAWTTFGIPLTRATTFATEYGFLLLAVPVVWITVALAVQARDETSDAPEAATCASGVLVLLVLLVGAFQAAALPWVRLFSCSFSLSA
jgi:undecaprenyl pyrophosphate phosphatase UppP